MTQQKSFKSRIRERMDKTGERYTTARHHLINKATEHVSDDGPAGTTPSGIAPRSEEQRISDDVLLERTGRVWDDWFALLDEWGGTKRTHAEIARWLNEEQGVAGWWSQTLTVGYQQARGIRVPGQSSDGSFSATASKTVNVSAEDAFDAFADEDRRFEWLPDAILTPRTVNRPKSFRADWEDGSTRLVVWLTPRGETKTQVAIQHEKLTDGESVIQWKAYWREQLNALKKVLEG